MKKNIFVLLLLSSCSINKILAVEVDCEKIEDDDWGWGYWKTCFMNQKTEINSANTTIISRDEYIEGLRFYNNKRVFFLPVGLSEKVLNLMGLSAGSCSLTTISKANFKGLNKLRYLFLSDNKIEKINSDVFDDSVALEHLYLNNNKLKFINGKAFARLTKLTGVVLNSNQCINQDFVGASRIGVLQQTVDEKCSIDEFELDEYVKKTFSIVSDLADKKCDENQDLASFTTTIEGFETKTSEVISKLNELKTQQKEECGNIAKALEALTKSHAKALKDQQTYFIETLKEQTEEIIDVKAQIISKMSEIEKLREELQRKNEQIIENNGKIKKLEEKI